MSRGMALLRVVGQVEAEREHDLGRRGHHLGTAYLRGHRSQHAEDVLGGRASCATAGMSLLSV
jgi:hypothetical protein